MISLIIQRWTSFSATTRAIGWNLLSGLLFSVMSALVKFSGQTLPTAEVVFGRSLFGFLAIAPFIFYAGARKVFSTDRWRLQCVRSVIGVSAMTCTFYSLAKLPLVDVTAINFSKPIFILILAAMFLRERVNFTQWFLTAAGFAGILTILRPIPGSFDANYLVAVLAAVLVSVAITLVKELTESESPFSVLAWFSALSTILSLPLALYYWREPSAAEWQSLIWTGMVGVVAQFCVIRSYALAPASYLAPLGYINILYTGTFGAVIFGHIPDMHSILGAAVIMFSTFYLMRKDGRKAADISEN